MVLDPWGNLGRSALVPWGNLGPWGNLDRWEPGVGRAWELRLGPWGREQVEESPWGREQLELGLELAEMEEAPVVGREWPWG